MAAPGTHRLVGGSHRRLLGHLLFHRPRCRQMVCNYRLACFVKGQSRAPGSDESWPKLGNYFKSWPLSRLLTQPTKVDVSRVRPVFIMGRDAQAVTKSFIAFGAIGQRSGDIDQVVDSVWPPSVRKFGRSGSRPAKEEASLL